MRLLIETFVRWLIAAGLYLGAFAYFRLPAGTDLTTLYIHFVAAGVVIGIMIVVSALMLEGIDRWVTVFLCAAFLSLGICVYHRLGGAVNFGSEPANIAATFIVVLALLLMTLHMVARTCRFLLLLSCWCDQEEVKKWITKLDSSNPEVKRLAIRTLADYLNRTQLFDGWPAKSSAAELEVHAAMVKKLWAAKEAVLADCPSQERLLQRLGRKMKDSFWRLAQCRLDWMVTQIPEYFGRSGTHLSSGSTQTSLPGEEDIAALSEQALSLPEPLPPLDPNRLIDTLEGRITEALEKAARLLNDAPSGALIVASEEPVGELLAQLLLEAYQVGLLLRMGSDKIDVPELFSTEGGTLKKTFRLFDEMVERAGDTVKDYLMDLNILAEEVQAEPLIEELPFMSPDEFMVAMRLHVDEALWQFVDIMNQTPTGLILLAEEASVCRLFTRMHARALELGLELRLKRAESLYLTGKSKEKKEPTPHLRKAASPSLPPPFIGWAEKYRHMRIAGTRFPLLREESRTASTKPDSS